jgi:hypothetical protein
MTTAAELAATLEPVFKDDSGPRAVWQMSPCILDYFIPAAKPQYPGYSLPKSYGEVADHVNEKTGLTLTQDQVFAFCSGWGHQLCPIFESEFFDLGMQLHERWLIEKWLRLSPV